MVYKNKGAALYEQQFIFWDGLSLNINNSPDKVCKCLIKTVCEDKNDVNSNCYVSGTNNNQFEIDSGEFSLEPSRLPIKVIKTKDVDHEPEAVKYSIGKLNCSFFFTQDYVNITADDSSKDLCKNGSITHFLEDPGLCRNYLATGKILKLKAKKPFKIINFKQTLSKNCDEEILVYIKEETQNKMCKFIERCKFICPETNKLSVVIIKGPIQNIDMCRVLLR